MSTSETPAEVAEDIGEGRDLVAFTHLPPERQEQVAALLAQLNVSDSQSIIGFGTEAQRELTTVSEQILEGVRNKDTGPAGNALNDMMLKVRELDITDLRDGKTPNWFQRVILGRINPIARFMQKYEQVRSQVDRIHEELESHRLKMTQDIARLDKLYEVTLEYFHDLGNYIIAAEERLRRLDEEEIPRLRAQAESEADGEMLATQKLADLSNARNDLERKLHDLKLTRQVTMQSLPSIRINQDLDKSLVTKIQSVLVNTLPLWKNQLAQAVTLFRTKEASETLHNVNKTTNELLEANAAGLKAANRSVRTVVEEGIFSIDSVERANQNLIEAIQESITITDEGRRKRVEAEGRLQQAEQQLKDTLRATAEKQASQSHQ